MRGFTLIELLIVLAIMAILVAVLVPSYQHYTRRAHYSEIVQAAAPYKMGVEACYQMIGDLSLCTAGENGIPPNIPTGQGHGLVDSIQVSDNGQITLTPVEQYGILSEDTYIMTPRIQNDAVIWSISGMGVTK
ncbi:MAG: pilus assembly protein PilA, partial [Gammaproteobacteria bacterium RIFCSPHIGHO2_12_FULL_45_9]